MTLLRSLNAFLESGDSPFCKRDDSVEDVLCSVAQGIQRGHFVTFTRSKNSLKPCGRILCTVRSYLAKIKRLRRLYRLKRVLVHK